MLLSPPFRLLHLDLGDSVALAGFVTVARSVAAESNADIGGSFILKHNQSVQLSVTAGVHKTPISENNDSQQPLPAPHPRRPLK